MTIDLQDCQSPKVNVDNKDEEKYGVLTFSGSVAGAQETEKYAMELELAHEVKPTETKISATPRHVFIVIVKKEQGFWERLQRKPGKLPYVKVDWNKWVDEDDMDEGKDPFDLSAIENFAGLDGMDDDGDEDADSDDEEMMAPGEGANGSGADKKEEKGEEKMEKAKT